MRFEYGKAYRWVVEELAQSHPVEQAMESLIAQCEAAYPHPDWERLRALPYADISPLSEWLQRVFREEAPEQPLQGLWFGLFNPCNEDDEPSADIYICGAERFDATSNSNEWAVNPIWWPEGRYAESKVLADIYRIAYEEDDGLGNVAEYPLCLGYGAFVVREILGKVEPVLSFGGSPSVEVAVGFDSGDFILLGKCPRDA